MSDTTDDMEANTWLYFWALEGIKEKVYNLWSLWFHRDRKWKLYKISQMKTSHLLNIKKYFKSEIDTLPIELELEYRRNNS
jgi:hypothetical protein